MTSDQQPHQTLSQQIDLDFALQAAGLGVWELDPGTNSVRWDDQCRALFGLAKDNLVAYEQAIQYIHPQDVERVNQAVGWALNPASGGHYDQTYRTLGADDGQLRWVRFMGRAYFTDQGQVYRFAGVAQEITQQVRTQLRLEASEARFTDLITTTPAATAVFTGREMRIQQVNDPMLAIWGKDGSVVGKTLHEAMPELDGQPFLAQLQHVFDTGEPFRHTEAMAQVIANGQPRAVYFNHGYNPLYDPDGQIYGVINTATDVTAQVLARQQIEASEAKLNLLSNTVPSMIFYLDQQQRYRSYNQTFMDWFGVDATQALGQTVREFIGEQAYQQVAPHLAVAYGGQPERYEILAPTRFKTERWLDITYTPHHTEAGDLLGVIVLANDISAQVQARKALEESRTSLQNAIQVGGLGTFSVDIATGLLTCNARVADWFGFDSLTAETETFIGGVGETERDYVRDNLQRTIQAGLEGRYLVTHSIINAKTGHRTLIDAVGRVYLDSEGQPLRIEGIAQDVTAQRELQSLLESQVQERTLALTLANQDLKRSNDNLQQFAYIASHDLQEPLRKIQSFATLITEQLAGQPDESIQTYLERITAAGARMSSLIKDLLAYSRISTRQQTFGAVSLGAIVAGVLAILDWEIQQSGALIQVDELPIVRGDESQLSQLFQNLLTNALKFVLPGQVPHIQIQYFQRSHDELPPEVRPVNEVAFYHQISVCDQGVGFEMKYVDRIFQVFQRLHGKNEFAGTGIGLAIVQRVVENHGGGVTASSQPGQGATFCIYLPA